MAVTSMHVGIGLVKRMAFWTMCLGRIDGGWAEATHSVLSWTHSFKMFWIHTATITAQVIPLFSFGRSSFQVVVRKSLPSIKEELSVSIQGASGQPLEAAISTARINFPPKANRCGSFATTLEGEQGITVALPAIVVKATETLRKIRSLAKWDATLIEHRNLISGVMRTAVSAARPRSILKEMP